MTNGTNFCMLSRRAGLTASAALSCSFILLHVAANEGYWSYTNALFVITLSM